MHKTMLAGVALAALLPAPLLAQTAPTPGAETPAPGAIPDNVTGYSQGSVLDTLVPAEGESADDAPVASTGNPVLDRLNALEAKVNKLEARNKELEAAAAATQDRVQKVEVRAAKGVQATAPAPTFADVGGNFTFKPRGVIELDYAAYNERAGGYDYNNGTDIRRARFGFDGTFYRDFKYRIEAEYVKGAVNLLDAYISYAPSVKTLLTVGQQKAPYGLEPNTSDSFNTFLERGMANAAFGAVGAERRVGVTAAYVTDKLNATVGFFGAGEAVQRDASTPDETYGVNGRITWDPVLDTGRLIHVGASGYHVSHFAANTISNLGDRPNTRVDGGRIISVNIPGTAVAGAPQTGARDATYYGLEAAGIYGPLSVQGEYNHLSVDRFGTASTVKFDGFYVFGSWFVTGESRAFKNGVVDRQKPFADFNPATGDIGAIELAVRYDRLDLGDRGLAPIKRQADSWTGAVNWYLNPYLKLMINYVRFKGINSGLVVAPVALNGTTAKGDALTTRLHLDF